ncbi:uncharacterized protein CTHT_0005320 [Thermochaetoides thermophila DSM 1495]|uniref:Chromosome transmission fidelity protein 8 n=1 Tax=Chaetomium thermophilum (strain DSM 1495 / CBS 144.50 / IMI 039719) TaxID=759272 RepID=G0RY41_CHATD|nr:hypothetical protein CTHT_0005320 [Thermochaetoides thermophila DSM 1495]EGS23827.1 hypothetical protein CTHT_0005320 [Thermochaetoides thermophila DSM 1495]
MSVRSVSLYPPPPPSIRGQDKPFNPLPHLIRTPSGLALLELQGTINLPGEQQPPQQDCQPQEQDHVPIGRIHFPDYNPNNPSEEGLWMKRVWLYVGKHQRLLGEVKKMPRAMAVVRKRKKEDGNMGQKGEEEAEELEVLEIVKYKLVFSQRPEPVG